MKISTGKVVSGKVVVEGEPLRDGAKVMVISREGDETFELSPQEEAEVLSAMAEADRGGLVDACELIKSLGKPS